jgi:hypothetical protein
MRDCPWCQDGFIEAGQWPCPECRGTGMLLDDEDDDPDQTDEEERDVHQDRDA